MMIEAMPMADSAIRHKHGFRHADKTERAIDLIDLPLATLEAIHARCEERHGKFGWSNRLFNEQFDREVRVAKMDIWLRRRMAR